MKRVRQWILWGILGIVVFICGWYVVISFPRVYFEKDFTLSDLNNRPLRLSHFAGQPIVLYFFSPRCKDCKEETPWLNELYATYRKDGLVVIGVGIKYTEEVRKFVEEQGIEYPVVVDVDLAACKDFGVFFLPHLVFINRQGKIAATVTGKVPPEKLKEHLGSIL